MPVIFYSMKGCGFCVKTEQMFASEIANGEIIKKNSSEARGKFKGFPSFENSLNGKTHSGLPSSKKALYQKLGVNSVSNNVPDWANYYVEKTKLNPESPYYILISSPNLLGTSLVGHLLQQPSYLPINNHKNYSMFIPVYTSTSTTPSPFIIVNSPVVSLGTLSNPPVQTFEQVEKKEWNSIVKSYLLPLFPCTKLSDWATEKSIAAIKPELLLPPQTCKNNKNVYCCPGNDDKYDAPFFDTKTIVMLSVIGILLIALIVMAMKK